MMSNENNSKNKGKTIISEINNHENRRANYTIESNNTKPYDINKMTGKPSEQTDKK